MVEYIKKNPGSGRRPVWEGGERILRDPSPEEMESMKNPVITVDGYGKSFVGLSEAELHCLPVYK